MKYLALRRRFFLAQRSFLRPLYSYPGGCYLGSWTVVRKPFCLMILDGSYLPAGRGSRFLMPADTPSHVVCTPWLGVLTVARAG